MVFPTFIRAIVSKSFFFQFCIKFASQYTKNETVLRNAQFLCILIDFFNLVYHFFSTKEFMQKYFSPFADFRWQLSPRASGAQDVNFN